MIKNIVFQRFLYITIIFLILNPCLFSQEYFQQEVNYRIDVLLDDINHELFAEETITYINNSPDTLNFIYFHLWANAYKNNSTAFARQQLDNGNTTFYFAPQEQKGYIDSLDFKVNGKPVKWEYDSEYIDICKLFLNEPLKNGEKIIITTPFHIKLPLGIFSRLGHIGQSYQITQWYPKPAVYDKYGWHPMPYLDIGEFYSEFGSFDVSITVPENYVVAATGNLMNEDELLWLEQKAEQTKQLEGFDEDDTEFPVSDTAMKTLQFVESNIHDFAWFADKRYNVLKGEVQLPHTGKKVTSWVMFTNEEAYLWLNALEYINDALYYYSLWNGDYPYNNCTAVMGALSAGGGMEYPTITIIGYSYNALSLEQVIMHEVGHNWFYGVLGSNERRHPWMDEGINSFNELRYIRTKYPNMKLYETFINEGVAKFFDIQHHPHKYYYETGYLLNTRRNLDQPASLHSEKYSLINYGTIVYMKTALAFNYLINYLGEDTFDKIMREYYEKWKFKHPYPEDLRKIFEANTDKNLNWFFDDLLQTTKTIDYKIKRFKDNKILIKNRGQINSPFSISALKDNEVISTLWYEGFDKKQTITSNFPEFDLLEIDAQMNLPDINRKNNTLRAKGVFKKIEPIRFQFLGSLENPGKTQIYYLPAIGYNYYNKFMLGALFYNSLLPQKKLEYQLLPFYSFGNNNFAGSGKIEYNIYPGKTFIQNLTLSISALQYAFDDEKDANFQRYKAEADILLKKKITRSRKDSRIIFNTIAATNMEDYIYNNTNSLSIFYNLGYKLTNKRKINPYNISVNLQAGDGFAKSFVETNYKITYNSQKKGLSFRFFAGKFLYNADYYYGNYNFRLCGSNGYRDYTYNNIFLGRLENIRNDDDNHLLSQQFVKNDGGFAIYTLIGQTNDWLITLNLSTSFPGKVPLKLYVNVGTYADINEYYKSDFYVYETGIELSIIPDIFAIYFPVIMSDDLKILSDSITDNYWQKIRFTLNLNKLNPFLLIKDLDNLVGLY